MSVEVAGRPVPVHSGAPRMCRSCTEFGEVESDHKSPRGIVMASLVTAFECESAISV